VIRLCQPAFDTEDRARIDEVLASGMLVQGRFVGELEAAIAARVGREVAACANGTAALHLAFLAAGIGPGDEVIVPGLTWPSAASVAQLVGARCRFVDVDPERFHLTLDGVRAARTSATKAIVAIHQFGIPAPMGDLVRYAESEGLLVIEDAACAIGTVVDGQQAGSWGTFATFSFHPRKVVTTGEGGAVTASTSEGLARVRCLRNHGQDGTAGLLRFAEPGLNYRLPELSAVLGLGQLARLDATLARHRALARRYADRLAQVDGVAVPAGVLDPGNNVQSFVVRLREAVWRDAVLVGLREAGVECTIGTYAVAPQPAFGAARSADHPHAWDAMHTLITLPLHAAMLDEDVDTVVATLDRCLTEARS
jgi:perosamine synthetase